MPIPNASKYWSDLKNEVRKQLPNITDIELQMGASSSGEKKIGELDEDESFKQLYELIGDIFEIYFGKDRLKVSNALIDSIITYVLEHFYMLTVSDIEFSFKRAQIDYEYTQAVTARFFCKFIHQWYNVRQKIWYAKREIVKRHEQKTADQIKYEEFARTCVDKYRQCMKSGEWTGNLHESNLLAKKIISHLPQDEEQQFRELARKQRIAILSSYEDKQKKGNSKSEPAKVGDLISYEDSLFATEERLFAKMVCEWGVINDIKI